MQCKFCRTELHPEADICSGCSASKGWGSYQGQIYSFFGVLFFGIGIPVILTGLISYVTRDVYGSPMAFFVIMVVMGIPFSVQIIWAIYNILRGQRWFKPTNWVLPSR